jgi:predicted transcriptional regulator
MIATTTLKLPDGMKERIVSAAEAADKTQHSWMIHALAAQLLLSERCRSIVECALLAEQEVAEYGLAYDADEVFSYVKARAAGKYGKIPNHKIFKDTPV